MKKTNIIASFLCMAALASCGKEEAAAVSVPDGTQTAIVPTAGLSMSATPSVRAALPGGPVSGTTFPKNTENLFAVTAYKGTAAPSSDYSNAYFDNETVNSDAEGKLSFTNTQYYPADAEKLYFYAYSPIVGAGDYTAGTASAAPAVAWTIDGTQDIMYANVVSGIGKVSAGTTQPQPEFSFNHLLKQVRFKLVKGEGFGDGIYASSVKITNCRTQASLNLITGALTFTGNADQSIGFSGNYAIQKSGVEIGSLLCQAGETGLDIEIVAAGVTYKTSVTLKSTSTDITAGGAGVSHLVTLTFIGTQIVLSATITDWVDAGETSGTIQ